MRYCSDDRVRRRRPAALADVQPDEAGDALSEPSHVLHLVPTAQLQPPHLRAERPQVLQEHPVARRVAEPDPLQRLQRPAAVCVARAREQRSRKVPAGFELAEAGEAVRRELEGREDAVAVVVRACAEGDVEMEKLETDVCSQNGRSRVETCMRRAPEVREREGAQRRPATTEQEVVCDGVKEAGGVPRDVADVQRFEVRTVVQHRGDARQVRVLGRAKRALRAVQPDLPQIKQLAIADSSMDDKPEMKHVPQRDAASTCALWTRATRPPARRGRSSCR